MKKACLTLVLSIIIFAFSFVSAYALVYTRTDTQWIAASEFGKSSDAFTTINDTCISDYSEWSDFYSEICDAVEAGYYTGFTASLIPHNSSFSWGNEKAIMYIYIVKDSQTYYLCNMQGGRYLYREGEVSDVTIVDIASYLDDICGKLDALKTSLEKLITTNSLLNQMIRQLDHIDDALNDDTFPLLSALSSIDQRLVEVRNAIGNVTLNVDSLESLTIDAYDDTYLMDILNAALIYWENTDLGIQSLNTALFDTAASPLYVKLKSLQNRLDDIYLSIQVVQGYLYHTQNPSVISYLKKMSEALTQLQASGSEVPSTLYDIIANRISVNITSMATSVSNIAKNVAVLTTTIGYGGQQGQTLFVYVTDINAKLGKIYTKFSDLSVSTAYDDTNVIAAVNSVETALSNLSLDVGDIAVVPTDLTPVITSIDAVGVNIEDLNANFNTSLGSLVDKLDVIVDKSSESVENLTVEISVDNDAHNVFYVTDEDGNEESLVDFSGDVLKAGGKLLNFLFKVCFDGAIDNLDGSIDDMDSFYFDGAELGGSLWE